MTRAEFATLLQSAKLEQVKAALLENSWQIESSDVLYALYNSRNELAQVLAAAAPGLDLFAAAATGQLARLKDLIATGVDFNARAEDGFSALQLAAFFGQASTLKALIQAGADLDAMSSGGLRTNALLAAVAGPKPDLALDLLEAGAEPNVHGDAGFTPLHTAAANALLEVVAALLAHGADPRATNTAGQTALDLARERGHDAPFARLLLG